MQSCTYLYSRSLRWGQGMPNPGEALLSTRPQLQELVQHEQRTDSELEPEEGDPACPAVLRSNDSTSCCGALCCTLGKKRHTVHHSPQGKVCRADHVQVPAHEEKLLWEGTRVPEHLLRARLEACLRCRHLRGAELPTYVRHGGPAHGCGLAEEAGDGAQAAGAEAHAPELRQGGKQLAGLRVRNAPATAEADHCVAVTE
mmetsp:Transcript_40202/g.114893  ORF Transcript_40202/g.114893 Transcript_40202/m.114893 type:complete len:200 (+) Transcript_40202:2-601(+)